MAVGAQVDELAAARRTARAVRAGALRPATTHVDEDVERERRRRRAEAGTLRIELVAVGGGPPRRVRPDLVAPAFGDPHPHVSCVPAIGDEQPTAASDPPLRRRVGRRRRGSRRDRCQRVLLVDRRGIVAPNRGTVDRDVERRIAAFDGNGGRRATRLRPALLRATVVLLAELDAERKGLRRAAARRRAVSGEDMSRAAHGSFRAGRSTRHRRVLDLPAVGARARARRSCRRSASPSASPSMITAATSPRQLQTAVIAPARASHARQHERLLGAARQRRACARSTRSRAATSRPSRRGCCTPVAAARSPRRRTRSSTTGRRPVSRR